MVWARLDDSILDNPKIAKAGVIGFAMHVAAITWCCRNLTDGFVPYSRVRVLLDLSDLDLEYLEATGTPETQHESFIEAVHDIGKAEPDRVARRLVLVGLWHEDKPKGGFWLNDFLEYNPSREETEATRALKAEAGKRGAEKRWGTLPRESGVVPKNGRAVAAPMAPAIANPLAGTLAQLWHVEASGRDSASSVSKTVSKSRGPNITESTNVGGMAPAKALVMAPAMGSPMANGWQNDAPDPDPDPVPDREIPTPPSPRVLGLDGEGGAAWQAWREGVGRTTNGPVSELRASDKPDLVGFVNAHAGGLRGEALMVWIADTAAAFAAANDPVYGFTPRRCALWLDGGRKGARRGLAIVQSATNRAWTPPKEMP